MLRRRGRPVGREKGNALEKGEKKKEEPGPTEKRRGLVRYSSRPQTEKSVYRLI